MTNMEVIKDLVALLAQKGKNSTIHSKIYYLDSHDVKNNKICLETRIFRDLYPLFIF